MMTIVVLSAINRKICSDNDKTGITTIVMTIIVIIEMTIVTKILIIIVKLLKITNNNIKNDDKE